MPDAKKQTKPAGSGCLKAIVIVLSSAGVTIFLVMACVICIHVIAATTPLRNKYISHPDGLTYQDITLITSDEYHISAWYVPGTRPEAVILVHGIHANRDFLLPQALMLTQAGYHLIMLDMRGHGRSEGIQLTYGYKEALDVVAAVDYLAAIPDIKHIGVLGHSLGGAAAVRAAGLDPRIEAIIIQSSFSSLARVVDERFDKSMVLPKQPFAPVIIALAELKTDASMSVVDSARTLATMPPRPVLLIHGADDTFLPVHHAQQMFDAAREPKEFFFISGVGHGNPMVGHEAEYTERVLTFLTKAFDR